MASSTRKRYQVENLLQLLQQLCPLGCRGGVVVIKLFKPARVGLLTNVKNTKVVILLLMLLLVYGSVKRMLKFYKHKVQVYNTSSLLMVKVSKLD